MKKSAVLALVVYSALYVLSVGGINANFRATWPNLCMNERYTREHLVFAVGWSLIPSAPLVTPFITGFYQDGWTLEYRPCVPKQ